MAVLTRKVGSMSAAAAARKRGRSASGAGAGAGVGKRRRKVSLALLQARVSPVTGTTVISYGHPGPGPSVALFSGFQLESASSLSPRAESWKALHLSRGATAFPSPAALEGSERALAQCRGGWDP